MSPFKLNQQLINLKYLKSKQHSHQQILKNQEIRIHDWCGQRKWEQYHTPRNLVFALVGEVGELCEIFEDEYQPGLPELDDKIKFHIGEEMADILHNLIRLSDQCNIDLSNSLLLKMEKNSIKYPVDKVYGSSKKYDEY
ncbi:hypothetical protein pb186bvf_000962 [Paramecium bursaria]